jgi:hypothetical protein
MEIGLFQRRLGREWTNPGKLSRQQAQPSNRVTAPELS